MSSGERLVVARGSSSASPCIDPSAIPDGFNGHGTAVAHVGAHPVKHTTLLDHKMHSGHAMVVDYNNVNGGYERTQYPYVTGSSVMALTFQGGVMIAADTLGSYGATKRYKSVERVREVGGSGSANNKCHCILGAGGEISDFHYIMTLVEELATEEFCNEDGISMEPKDLHEYLSRVLYNRRNK